MINISFEENMRDETKEKRITKEQGRKNRKEN